MAVTICHFAKYPTWKRFSIRDIFLIHPVYGGDESINKQLGRAIQQQTLYMDQESQLPAQILAAKQREGSIY